MEFYSLGVTYEELVDMLRVKYEDADARHIFEHIAMQVNIEGEGAGALYVEVAQRAVCVEPYDYHDRDGLLTTDACTIIDLTSGRLSVAEALEQKRIHYSGNPEKLRLFLSIKNRN